MARFSPTIAKNVMTRAMYAIIDPLPSPPEVEKLWSHFEGKCAYCGCTIERASRTGHLDHVRAAAEGGSNNVFNHVLACARCNGDLKRETLWSEFLERTVADPLLREERKARIGAWLARAPDRPVTLQAQAIIQTAVDAFDRSVAELRALRKPRAQGSLGAANSCPDVRCPSGATK